LGGETGEVWVPDLKAHPTFLADLITQAKDHINTLTPAQLAAAKAQEELENWKQSCEEAEHAGDLNQLTESLDKEHMYYQNMRQAMLMRAKALNCTFDKQRGTWISPPEFNGISDQQRDELQNFIAERGLDVKTVCEHLGIDALIQIEAAKLKAVKQEIETLAKTGMTA
ncbi:AAA family ATPase, partial [Acinetobacter baumannii]|nr:AAA family ATPase [Acinetobacter baumannii]